MIDRLLSSSDLDGLACVRASLWIAALVDRDLPDPRSPALTRHVRDCPSCRRMLLTAIKRCQRGPSAGGLAGRDLAGPWPPPLDDDPRTGFAAVSDALRVDPSAGARAMA